MLSKGPHISIEYASLVPRTLRIPEQEFAEWPEAVRALTIEIAKELFLVYCNPYISPETVRKSVQERFAASRRGLAHHYVTSISEGLTMFWSAHEEDVHFRDAVIAKLSSVLPKENIDTSKHALVVNATDATDLRLELPLLVVTPTTAEQVSNVVQLANEMQFALVPRGGGSGATGGAIPARKRSVILALTKLTKIYPVDKENMSLRVQAGVITSDAISAAAKENLLFSVDPASKTASSIGGNIAENAGGPLCFEYGTTIDNLLSFRMVTPTGELIEVIRQNHPRRAIEPSDDVIFEVRDMTGGLRSLIKMPASEIRTPGLGKDVTNKALSGLPGLQKEGTDGVIIDATFTLHKSLKYYKVMALEFFGRSMENCMLVVSDIVALRNDIRRRGSSVKISALEEFNGKYVKAINYRKKSEIYEGDPISVLIVQLDSDDEVLLEQAVEHVVHICETYDGVDAFVAKDNKQAEHFWEDRHKLSAIAKHTSGFKINEDVVIPMRAIPEFALYLEALNLECMARAYRTALKKISNLKGLPEEELRVTEELAYSTRIVKGEILAADLSDEELELHATLFLRSLAESYPAIATAIENIEQEMISTRICVASHMHAGDGNCHVNIPVNSNDPEMMHAAETAAALVMGKAQELGGEVTGEHGIGITKIAFLTDKKMADFREYKQLVDPRSIFNPAKLTQKKLPVAPYTFSFNRLIQDIQQSGLENKERLISLLTNVQTCTRCGKCKQFCPMHYPEQSLLYHPRNKNLILGALIEAIYYSQVNTGKPDPFLLSELGSLVEHCTGCGKCMAVCPLKISSHEIALTLRGFLEEEGAGGHPIKSRVINILAQKPEKYIPAVAKLASLGQGVQNKVLPLVPASWRNKFANPLFSGQGPRPGYRNLMEALHLEQGSIFVPKGHVAGTVLYFPGCGGAIFFRSIGLAGLALLLRAGYAVVLPKQHLCCGYPLLAAGAHDAFATNQDKNITHLRQLAQQAQEQGYPIGTVLTACGSCRDGMERHFIPEVFPKNDDEQVKLSDVTYFLLANSPNLQEQGLPMAESGTLLYHSPCHAEVPGLHKAKAAGIYAAKLGAFTGRDVKLSPGCCGESGMGAMTSPAIYNKIRNKKAAQLSRDMENLVESTPVIVGCPSCKMGLTRILMNGREKRRVLHTLEFFAEHLLGERWQKKFRKIIKHSAVNDNVRIVDIAGLSSVQLSEAEAKQED